MADLAKAEWDLADAGTLELTVVATRPISRLLFDPWRTWIARDERRSGEAYRGAPAPEKPSRTRSDARSAPLPSADELRRRIYLASPTEIRVELPEDLADGGYMLSLGLEYPEGDDVRRTAGSIRFTIDRGTP